MKVSWFSAGVSSFCATYLLRKQIDKIIYIHIDDQHPDTLRFVRDCETLLDRPIEIMQSPYLSVDTVCRAFRFLKSPYGAKCTDILKKRVRKEWESQQTESVEYVWGFDFEERNRAERLLVAMPHNKHHFPLIDAAMRKVDAHGLAKELGLKRPAMYDLGYPNNNCIGCLKGGMGYWAKIQTDFPEVFASRCKLERDIGAHCLKEGYLDEVDLQGRGRALKPVVEECGIMCQMAPINEL